MVARAAHLHLPLWGSMLLLSTIQVLVQGLGPKLQCQDREGKRKPWAGKTLPSLYRSSYTLQIPAAKLQSLSSLTPPSYIEPPHIHLLLRVSSFLCRSLLISQSQNLDGASTSSLSTLKPNFCNWAPRIPHQRAAHSISDNQLPPPGQLCFLPALCNHLLICPSPSWGVATSISSSGNIPPTFGQNAIAFIIPELPPLDCLALTFRERADLRTGPQPPPWSDNLNFARAQDPPPPLNGHRPIPNPTN